MPRWAIWSASGTSPAGSHPQGNIGKYSDSEIENWVEWSGEPGALISALVESKWLDQDENHRLIIHDRHQHADKATKLALKRGNLEFCTHTVPTVSVQRGDTAPDSGTVYGLPVSEIPPTPAAKTAAAHLEDEDPFRVAEETFDLTDAERAKAWAEANNNGNGAAKRSLLNPETETVLDQVALRIHGRHPAVRGCGIGEVKKRLRTIARGASAAQRIDLLHRIDQNHASWCKTSDWQKDGGQYAKGLDNWLAPAKERWNESPATPAAEDPEPPKLCM